MFVARTTDAGVLSTGSRYLVEVPEDWNEILLLYSRPVPVGPDDPPWPEDDPFIGELVGRGYSVAGSANTIFWPLELAFDNLVPLLDAAEAAAGTPRHVIGFGLSIGGIITAGLTQRFPGRISGALPMCGNLAGAVGIHNRELDIAFVVKTLLAPDSELELVNIADPPANLERARAVLADASATAQGRARLALAAAVGNIPGWHDPAVPEPSATNMDARFANQLAWYEEVGFLVYFWARAQVEQQAGGNPSWNAGVDYAQLLENSINRDEVDALYAGADLDLGDDLAALAAAPRIEADPEAVSYLERHVVFDGDLRGVPTLALHTDGDGLVTPDNEHAYAEVVRAAGSDELLRQIWIHRGGHCSFTMAEVLAALSALVERLESGTWPALDPAHMNARAEQHGSGANALRSGEPTPPAFFDYEPRPFSRPYDMRDRAATPTRDREVEAE